MHIEAHNYATNPVDFLVRVFLIPCRHFRHRKLMFKLNQLKIEQRVFSSRADTIFIRFLYNSYLNRYYYNVHFIQEPTLTLIFHLYNGSHLSFRARKTPLIKVSLHCSVEILALFNAISHYLVRHCNLEHEV